MASNEKLTQLIEADPQAALKLLHRLQKKTVIPHEGGQRQIMENDTRFKIVCCGRRFGKTVIAAKKALEKCRSEPDQVVWWVAPTYKVVKRGYNEVVRQLPKELLVHEPPQDSSFDAGRSVKLRFKNGSVMEFYSSERPEGMLGEGVDLAVLDEAATMRPSLWFQIVRPTLMDRNGGALMISTPRGRNWFYYLWLKGQDDSASSYASWRFPTSANPYIGEGEIEEMKADLPMLEYEQEVLAEFISSAGAVFRFNPDIIVKRVPPKGHVVVGVDLAKANDFTVLTAANMDDMLPCGYDHFNEIAWPHQRARIRGFVKTLEQKGASAVTLMVDATGVGEPVVEELELEGYDVLGIKFTASQKRNMVIQLAKDFEDGVVRLDETEKISEYENYTYKVTESGNWTYSAPEGQHDDCVSAKMLQHWGIVQEGAPNIVAIAADPTKDKLDDQEPERRGDSDEYDYSDLIEDTPVVDTGIPERLTLTPDSPIAIMGRGSAWTGIEQ